MYTAGKSIGVKTVAEQDVDEWDFISTVCPGTKALCLRHRYLVCNTTLLT
jgi:hypothetical protein